MNKNTIAVSVLAVALIGGGIWVGVSSLRKSSQPTAAENQQPVIAQQNAEPQVEGAQATNNQENKMESQAEQNFVTLEVKDFGKIVIELYPNDAPKTVENFVKLTQKGYYDGITFHRIAKGFVIQGGDPTGTGRGGESIFGGEFADELNPDTESYKNGYKKGVVAMANRGPNTNSSQFFIMLSDAALPHNYTIFGKVVSGQEVVDKIGQLDIVPNPGMGPNDGAPKIPVIIQKAILGK